MNKLLLISYNFPPINSAGVFRVATFAGHLCNRGWDITVLTVRGSSTETRDQSLMDLIPDGMRVVRTACPEFNRVTQRIRPAGFASAGDQTRTAAGPASGRRRRRRGPIGVVGRFVHRVLTFPDPQVGWVGPLFWNAARIIRRDHISYVMSTSPPHSSHLPIAALRSIVRFRWVVDFRDPWTAPRRVAPYALGWQRRLEGWVLKRADAIIANTTGNREVLLQTFPGIAPEKVFVITNGFDVSRFESVLSPAPAEHGESDRRPDLVYVGSVYPEMLDFYIAGLLELRAAGARLPRLRIYGVFETPEEQAKIAGAGLGDVIEYAGRVPYEESLRVIAGAPALLLLVPNGERFRNWVPSKLYPYLFSGRPILAIAPPGDSARIVTGTRSGMVVSGATPADVAAGIEEFLRRVANGDFQDSRDTDAIDAYRTERLVDQLDGVLKSCPV